MKLFTIKKQVQKSEMKVTCFDQLLDELLLHANSNRELSDLLLRLKKAQLRKTFETFQTSTERRLHCAGTGCIEKT